MTALDALTVADTPDVWTRLGFVVQDSIAWVGRTGFVLGGPSADGAKGILDWTLHDPSGVLPSMIEGLVTNTVLTRRAVNNVTHPNGIVSLDHLVVMSPDLERTIEALEDLEIMCRRRRDAGAYGSKTMRQAFFWLGSVDDPTDRVILEVVGEAEPDPAKKNDPASFFGVALTCSDLDATLTHLGEFAKPPVDAVQPGRRISSISSKAGASVAIALMSPHVD